MQLSKCDKKTYFGLDVYVHINGGQYVLHDDIHKLSFFDFWKESAKGSTNVIYDGLECVYLYDWEAFSELFIKTGKHRFNLN